MNKLYDFVALTSCRRFAVSLTNVNIRFRLREPECDAPSIITVHQRVDNFTNICTMVQCEMCIKICDVG